MRKTITVAALLLTLVCSAHAGEMQNETPAPHANTAQEPTGGETLNGEIPTPPGISDSLTQIALELLASVLP